MNLINVLSSCIVSIFYIHSLEWNSELFQSYITAKERKGVDIYRSCTIEAGYGHLKPGPEAERERETESNRRENI
jgi:hypothetical protein